MSLALKIALTVIVAGMAWILEYYARTGWGLSVYGKKFIRVCYVCFGVIALLVIWLS